MKTTILTLSLAHTLAVSAAQWLWNYNPPQRLPAPTVDEWCSARKANLPRPGEVYRMRGHPGPSGPSYTVLDVESGRVRYGLRADSWPVGMVEMGVVGVAVFRRSTILVSSFCAQGSGRTMANDLASGTAALGVLLVSGETVDAANKQSCSCGFDSRRFQHAGPQRTIESSSSAYHPNPGGSTERTGPGALRSGFAACFDSVSGAGESRPRRNVNALGRGATDRVKDRGTPDLTRSQSYAWPAHHPFPSPVPAELPMRAEIDWVIPSGGAGALAGELISETTE